MEYSTVWDAEEVIALQRAVFAASEGVDEGEVIAELTANLLATDTIEDVVSCSAADKAGLVGNIIFSRLFFEEDERQAFVLGPVAVAPDRQRKGVGTALISWGLSEVTRRGADIAVTYGDPAYYTRTGFQQIGVEIIRPPYPLQMPFGWMAQGLTDAPLSPVSGASRCVPAFARPEYW